MANDQSSAAHEISKMLFLSGLGVATVGVVALSIFFGSTTEYRLALTAAIAAFAAGAVLTLIGGQFLLRAPTAPVSTCRLFLESITRSGLVIVLFGGGVALLSGESKASDLAPLAGRAFLAVLAVDLIASKLAIKRLYRPA